MKRPVPVLWWLGVFSFAMLCGAQTIARADLSERAARIVAGMPEESPEARGSWLFETACGQTDAFLALRLMDEITRRFAGPPAQRAGLWKVRFYMAAGDTASAARELRGVAELPARGGGGQELGYWRTLLTEDGPPTANDPDVSIPPWGLMTQIAAASHRSRSRSAERRVLEVEGAARRWGLFAPWVWQLVSSDDAWLRQVGRGVLGRSGLDLAGSPELAEIRRILDQPLELEEYPETPGVRQHEEEPPSIPQHHFTVEVGAFMDEASASALAQELQGYGFEAYHKVPVSADAQELYRVRMGVCATWAQAESLGMRLSRTLMLSYQIVEDTTPISAEVGADGGRRLAGSPEGHQ